MKSVMKNLTISLMSVILIANVGYAQECKSPNICFTEERARAVRKELIEKDYLEGENKSLKSSLKLTTASLSLRKEQVDMLSKNNDKLAERLRESSKWSQWKSIMWFGLGVLATGLAVKGAKSL